MSKRRKKSKSKGTPLIQQAINSGKVKVSQGQSGQMAVQKKSNRTKVLMWGASPFVITGFGVVSKKMLQNLFSAYPDQYEVYQVGINHTGDAYNEFDITGGTQNGRYQLWPAIQAGNNRTHLYGQQKFLQVLQHINVDFDVVFLFEDPFWVGGGVPGVNPPKAFIDAIKEILARRGMGHVPVVSYFPIDGVPRRDWITNIAKVDFPITYLNFGVDACVRVVPELSGKLTAIPHGVDLNDFHPIDVREKRLFKRAMFGDAFADRFMFLNVNRNQLRKLVPSNLLAFRAFREQVGPDKAFIYLNMKTADVGWDLNKVCESLGLRVGVDVLFPPNFNVQKGLSLEQLNKVFNVADVLTTTAVGGGWELALTQAFATKTSVIAPHNTSHIELCGPQNEEADGTRGLLYKSGETLSRQIVFPHDNEVPRPLPNLEDMVHKMLFAYSKPEFREKMEDNAYNWVKDNLSWSRDVVPQFHKVFSAAKELKADRIKGNNLMSAVSDMIEEVPEPKKEEKQEGIKQIDLPGGTVI